MDASGTARRAFGNARREEDRIQSAAVFAQRRSAAVSDRDEGWKSALNAHIQAIFCGGTEKDGLRALANSKGVRPLPWHGWLSRRKRPWAPFPGCVFLCSISHLLFFAFCAVPGAVRVFSCTMKEMAFGATAGGSGCFYAQAARRMPAKRRSITQKCVAHGGMEKR